MEWGVEFYRDAPIDELFVHRLFYRLVAEGSRYNASRYPGKFFITGGSLNEEVIEEEEKIEERTQKLADIVTRYCSQDTRNRSLAVHLNYVDEPEFYFTVGIRPDGSSSVVKIQTNTSEIETEEAFAEFITLCRSVIEAFDFVHGRYTNEQKESPDFNPESFIETSAEMVMFYSDKLVEEIGREKLLSAPVESVEELDDGVFLLACRDPFGCENVKHLREHLGQEKFR